MTTENVSVQNVLLLLRNPDLRYTGLFCEQLSSKEKKKFSQEL